LGRYPCRPAFTRLYLSLSRYASHWILHTFPTRRSSDLIADKTFSSHLVMGTGGATSQGLLEKSLLASQTELTTVAMRRHSAQTGDRKSTRLNSSHVSSSYAVFCLKKKRVNRTDAPRRTE